MIKGVENRGGGAGGFATSVKFAADAAGVSLFVVVDENHLVDDGHGVADRDLLERIGDTFGDEVTMCGLAADDQSEGDDAFRFVLLDQGFHGDRDFVGTGDPDDVGQAVWHEFFKLLLAVFDQCIREFLIVGRGDNHDLAALVQTPGPGGKCRGHANHLRG